VLAWARIGDWVVSADDVVACDEDGVIFLPFKQLAEIVEAAEKISSTERRQASEMRAGRSFVEQKGFADYLARRSQDTTLGFREYLRMTGAAIEE
jgi:4-hydroxy-4-methyl-2-oxoglutarate aldolase